MDAHFFNISDHCKPGPTGYGLIHPKRFPCINFATSSLHQVHRLQNIGNGICVVFPFGNFRLGQITLPRLSCCADRNRISRGSDRPAPVVLGRPLRTSRWSRQTRQKKQWHARAEARSLLSSHSSEPCRPSHQHVSSSHTSGRFFGGLMVRPGKAQCES